MTLNKKLKIFVSTCFIATGLNSCGEKEEKDEDKEEPVAAGTAPTTGTQSQTEPTLESDTAVLDYALTALSSASVEDPAAATLMLEATEEDPNFTGCTEHGEPWDPDTLQRMRPSNEKFAYQTIKCQIQHTKATDTVIGNLMRNYRVLCDLERSLDAKIEYSTEGTEKSIDKMTITEGCGWSAGNAAETGEFSATVTGTLLPESDDWDKKLEIILPDMGSTFLMYMKAKGSTVAFKAVTDWNHSERGEDGNAAVEADNPDAVGVDGGLISVNVKAGTITAETIDTYWGRRTRLYAKGTIDVDTGAFTKINHIEAINANFSVSIDPVNVGEIGLYGEIATVKGDNDTGFKFHSVNFSCNTGSETPCDSSTDATKALVDTANSTDYCIAAESDDCSGNDGIEVGATEGDFDFLIFGAGFGSQSADLRDKIESWIKEAGLPSFTSVAKDPVLK